MGELDRIEKMGDISKQLDSEEEYREFEDAQREDSYNFCGKITSKLLDSSYFVSK